MNTYSLDYNLKNWTSVDYRPPRNPKYKWGLFILTIIIAALIYILW